MMRNKYKIKRQKKLGFFFNRMPLSLKRRNAKFWRQAMSRPSQRIFVPDKAFYKIPGFSVCEEPGYLRRFLSHLILFQHMMSNVGSSRFGFFTSVLTPGVLLRDSMKREGKVRDKFKKVRKCLYQV